LKQDQYLTFPATYSDDGFVTTAVEPWFKVKVQLIQHYFESFIENLHARADDIIFVDLFSGSGVYSVGSHRQRWVNTSLTALSVELKMGFL
jgi:hypothetical protein